MILLGNFNKLRVRIHGINEIGVQKGERYNAWSKYLELFGFGFVMDKILSPVPRESLFFPLFSAGASSLTLAWSFASTMGRCRFSQWCPVWSIVVYGDSHACLDL